MSYNLGVKLTLQHNGYEGLGNVIVAYFVA
jgi:hypothetical protein